MALYSKIGYNFLFMAKRKVKEPLPFTTEFWVNDKRGSNGYVLVNRFEGYIPYTPEVSVMGYTKNGSTYNSFPPPTLIELDILAGIYRVYLGEDKRMEAIKDDIQPFR